MPRPCLEMDTLPRGCLTAGTFVAEGAVALHSRQRPLTVSASFSVGLPCIMIVPWSFVKAGMDPKGTVSIGLRERS